MISILSPHSAGLHTRQRSDKRRIGVRCCRKLLCWSGHVGALQTDPWHVSSHSKAQPTSRSLLPVLHVLRPTAPRQASAAGLQTRVDTHANRHCRMRQHARLRAETLRQSTPIATNHAFTANSSAADSKECAHEAASTQSRKVVHIPVSAFYHAATPANAPPFCIESESTSSRIRCISMA